jgi:hypothetical protein
VSFEYFGAAVTLHGFGKHDAGANLPVAQEVKPVAV